jgi:uncharacterized Tic20 family protein
MIEIKKKYDKKYNTSMRLSVIGVSIWLIIVIFDIDTTKNLFIDILATLALIEIFICFAFSMYFLIRIINISNKIKKQERKENKLESTSDSDSNSINKDSI